MTLDALRAELCRYGRRLYEKGLVSATDGNLSVRIGDDRFLCTPSGCCKGELDEAMLVIADGRANLIEGRGTVTSEFFTHLAAYEERPDVQAVVHAHPTYATALSLAGAAMMDPQLPELVMALGAVPTAPYATPGSTEGGEVIRRLIREHNAVLLDRHGAVTAGATIREAYFAMERVEHGARVLWAARCLGPIPTLDADQVARARAACVNYKVLPPTSA